LTHFGLPPFLDCQSNEPLKALELAMTSPLAEEWNAGFLRDDGLLVVVIFSGRDDCSVRDDRFYSDPELQSPGCVNSGPSLFDVGEFAVWLDGLRPGGRVLVGLWGGRDGTPRIILDPWGAQIVEPLCSRGMAEANMSPRLHRLLSAFGDRAVFGDWCEEEVGDFMRRVGTLVENNLPAECWPGP
jgi:hypothetical protein